MNENALAGESGQGAAVQEACAPPGAGADVAVARSESQPARDSRPRRRAAISRRSLCLGVGGAAVMMGLGALGIVAGDPLCRPPGGQDESRLVSSCIRCQRCYEACPRHVIVPAHVENGLVGMRTPTLDFSEDYCDFCAEENGGVPLCVRACPTNALALPEGAPEETVVIGTAAIDTWLCLAYRDTACRACFDACPYGAIALSADEYNPLPSVVSDLCNGCGACESACLSFTAGSVASGSKERAIVVRPTAAVR